MKYSYYTKPINNTRPHSSISIEETYNQIKSDSYKDVVEELRKITNADLAKSFKAKNFDFVTFSGEFRERKTSGLTKFSNLVCIDFDNIANPKEAKAKLRTLEHLQPVLLFISPSGNGVKSVYKVEITLNEISQAYNYITSEVEQMIGLEGDPAPKSVASACFLCWDEDAYLNLEANPVILPVKWKQDPSIEKAYPHKTKNDELIRKMSSLVEYVEEHRINLADMYHDWVKVGFALANLGESGRVLYHKVSKQSNKYEEERCNKQFDTCLNSLNGDISIGTFYHLLDRYKVPCGEILSSFNPSFSITSSVEDYWNPERLEDHKCRVQKLKENPVSDTVQSLKRNLSVDYETLQRFNAGLGHVELDGNEVQCIHLPHLNGCHQLVEQNGRYILIPVEGAAYFDSYFGTENLSGLSEVCILESPLSALQYSSETSRDVISLVDNGNPIIDRFQRSFLEAKASTWKKVYVFKSAFGEDQNKDALHYVRRYADILPSNCEVYWVNPAEVKDLDSDEINYKSKASEINELVDRSMYVWNTNTERNRFWYLTDAKKPKLEIDELMLSRVLGNAGFKKVYLDHGGEPSLIRVEKNIVDLVTEHQLLDFIRDEILEKLSKNVIVNGSGFETRQTLVRLFLRYREKVLSKNSLAILRKGYVRFLGDDRDRSYITYNNGVTMVTHSSISQIPYSKIPGCVWRDQILERDFDLNDEERRISVFEQFVEKVTGGDKNVIDSFKTSIGYLLHTFKDKTITKAIILTDKETEVGKAQGGTGKSLFAESLKYIRKQCYIAAKNARIEDKFAFMGVRRGDQHIFFDDARENFDFEGLFNVITNDMQIEEKYKNRITIPFEESPKILIATNGVLYGQGNSFERRQHIIEFSSYFKNVKPEKEFNHRLYHDWDSEEWRRFDQYMIECLQLYLKKGLVGQTSLSYAKRRVISNTNSLFIEWADKFLEVDFEYSVNLLFNGRDKISGQVIAKPENSLGTVFPDFHDFSDGELAENQIKTFNSWLKSYASYRNWKITTRVTNGYNVITFRK